MHGIDFSKAVLASVVGTVVFSIVVLLANAVGLPGGQPWGMVANFLQAGIIVGWIGHFLIGIAFGLFYAGIAGRIPGDSPAAKGAVYGVVPWILAMLLAMPMMTGMPIFGGSLALAIVSLIGHVSFGAATGATYGHAYAPYAARVTEAKRARSR